MGAKWVLQQKEAISKTHKRIKAGCFHGQPLPGRATGHSGTLQPTTPTHPTTPPPPCVAQHSFPHPHTVAQHSSPHTRAWPTSTCVPQLLPPPRTAHNPPHPHVRPNTALPTPVCSPQFHSPPRTCVPHNCPIMSDQG